MTLKQAFYGTLRGLFIGTFVITILFLCAYAVQGGIATSDKQEIITEQNSFSLTITPYVTLKNGATATAKNYNPFTLVLFYYCKS